MNTIWKSFLGPPNDKEIFRLSQHNPRGPNLNKIINKHWATLGRSAATRHMIDYKVTCGKRRAPNLRDLLVRAKIPLARTIFTGHICKRSKSCRYCPLLNKSGKVCHRTTGQVFESRKNVCCQSSNVIYLLTCLQCGIQYVGQTKSRIMDRTWDHLNDTKKGKNTTVARHFNHHGPPNAPPIEVTILEFVKCDPLSARANPLRDSIEKSWIARLNTLIPLGLNVQDGG